MLQPGGGIEFPGEIAIEQFSRHTEHTEMVERREPAPQPIAGDPCSRPDVELGQPSPPLGDAFEAVVRDGGAGKAVRPDAGGPRDVQAGSGWLKKVLGS